VLMESQHSAARAWLAASIPVYGVCVCVPSVCVCLCVCVYVCVCVSVCVCNDNL
jgi:hypothetical protein